MDITQQPLDCIIIDDEIAQHRVLEFWISSNTNIKLVGQCFDAFQGMKMIEKKKPRVVFLDVNMQEMTGIEMLAEIPGIDFKAVIVTADPRNETLLTDSRIKGMLLKPVTRKDFGKIMKKLLAK